MCFLWWRQSSNYIWLLKNIFVPGAFNGLSGLITTFVNVYATQNPVLGASSIATLAVTGACTVICGSLAMFYYFWKLNPINQDHKRHNTMRRVARTNAARN
jgi:hypothetical protein